MRVLDRCYVERVSHMGKGITAERIAELERIGYGIPESGGDIESLFADYKKPTSIGMSIEEAQAIKDGLGNYLTTGFQMWSAGWQFGVCRQLGLFDQCELAKKQAARVARGIESHAVRSGLRDDWRSGVTLGIQAVLDDPEFSPAAADLGPSLPSQQKGW